MRLVMFFKLAIAALGISLLAFAILPDMSVIATLKMLALGVVLSMAVTAFYPEIRGVRAGDRVAVVTDSSIPAIIGRAGKAAAGGRKNDRIKITLGDGSEAMGVIESYTGLISHPRIRVIYEERLVE
jgi:hypothetical protein